MSESHGLPSTTEQRLAERYGRTGGRSAGRRLGLTAVVALLVAAVAWWVWVAAVQSNPSVTFQLVGYDNVTDSSVEVQWSVDRAPHTACCERGTRAATRWVETA